MPTSDRLRLEDIFSRIALKRDLGSEVDEILGQIHVWIAGVLKIPGITEATPIREVLDASQSPEGHEYVNSILESGQLPDEDAACHHVGVHCSG